MCCVLGWVDSLCAKILLNKRYSTSRRCKSGGYRAAGTQQFSYFATMQQRVTMYQRQCDKIVFSRDGHATLFSISDKQQRVRTSATQRPGHHLHATTTNHTPLPPPPQLHCALGLTQSPKIANAQICPSPNIKHKLLLLREYEKRRINKYYTIQISYTACHQAEMDPTMLQIFTK